MRRIHSGATPLSLNRNREQTRALIPLKLVLHELHLDQWHRTQRLGPCVDPEGQIDPSCFEKTVVCPAPAHLAGRGIDVRHGESVLWRIGGRRPRNSSWTMGVRKM